MLPVVSKTELVSARTVTANYFCVRLQARNDDIVFSLKNCVLLVFLDLREGCKNRLERLLPYGLILASLTSVR